MNKIKLLPLWDITMTKKAKWKSPKIKCNNCKDIIWSKYDGEFTVCKCYSENSQLVYGIMSTIDSKIPNVLYHKANNFGMKITTELGDAVLEALRKHIPNKGIFIDATPYYTRSAGLYSVVSQGVGGYESGE